MTENETVGLFKCLADKSRLQILKILAKEEMYVELLAERLGLSPATISFHMKKLENAGVVSSTRSQYYTMYSLRRDVFAMQLIDAIAEQSDEADKQAARDADYRQRVIDTFFEYGKLKQIPVQRKKERIVLEHIAEAFERDRKYTEREVNIIIADYHDDFCTLRRDMISEHLMERENGIYWRV